MKVLANFLGLFSIRCILCPVIEASSFTEPHSHTGVINPFQPGDPKITLDKKALGVLKSGKPYQTQIQSGTGGRGLVVQDVEAPTTIVWERILDYDNYAKMVPKTVESKNYKVENIKPTKKDPLQQIIYTRMKVGFPVLKLEFFIKHFYYPSLNSLTWTLDYAKNSDFNDSCGYWYVIPHPENSEWSRIFYSVEVSMFDWVPKFVVDFMSTKALTDATAWVKKFSESEAQNRPSMESASSSNVDPTIHKSKKFLGLFHLKKKKLTREKIVQDTPRRDSTLKSDKSEHDIKEDLTATWLRLSLIGIVSFLFLYNSQLFFSN